MFANCSCRNRLGWIWTIWLIGFAACSGCGATAEEAARDYAARKYDQGCDDMSKGKLGDAVAAFGRAMALNPQDARAVLMRAVACERQGDTDAAIAGYKRAIDLQKDLVAASDKPNPGAVPLCAGELAEAHLKRGLLHKRAGEMDAAVDDFTEAIKIVPEQVDPYYARGMAYLKRRYFDLALDDLTEAVRLDPSSYEVLCQRARACLALGKYHEVIEDCRSAIRLRPKSGEAFHMLGAGLLAAPNPQFDMAVDYLKRAST